MTVTHPLVLQLKFTRNEFKRALKGLSEEDASKRLLPMNCISWNVGHLAWQEQRYFLFLWQGMMPYPEVQETICLWCSCKYTFAEGDASLFGWKSRKAADLWLETLTAKKLLEQVLRKMGNPFNGYSDRCCSARSTTTGTTPAKTWRSGRC